MELYTMTRPAMPLSVSACAPSALVSAQASLVVAVPAVERALIPAQAVRPVAVLAAERAPAPSAEQAQALVAERAPASAVMPIHAVRQIQVQAELAQALTRIDGINGTNGTTGFSGIDVSKKRYADGGSGVPPRGRPV